MNLFYIVKEILSQRLTGMIELAKINEIVTRIATNFNPDKIILFGSYAAGKPQWNMEC